ncbi:hypothetical protein V2J09_005707 [Rumex salicifolius]
MKHEIMTVDIASIIAGQIECSFSNPFLGILAGSIGGDTVDPDAVLPKLRTQYAPLLSRRHHTRRVLGSVESPGEDAVQIDRRGVEHREPSRSVRNARIAAAHDVEPPVSIHDGVHRRPHLLFFINVAPDEGDVVAQAFCQLSPELFLNVVGDDNRSPVLAEHARRARPYAACSARSNRKPNIKDDLGRALADRLGSTFSYDRYDVSVEEQVRAVVDAAVARHGKLDVMYNNARIIDRFG